MMLKATKFSVLLLLPFFLSFLDTSYANVSSNKLNKPCFFCTWGEQPPSLPTFTKQIEKKYSLNKEIFRKTFQHSFDLNRTIYTNDSSRGSDYWFKQISITPAVGKPKGETGDVYYQMLTGDIPAMWARDSMWQIIPYILFAKSDLTSADACTAHPNTPSLRCLTRGTILSLAYFFTEDSFETNGTQPGVYFGVYKGANKTSESGNGFPISMTQVTTDTCTFSSAPKSGSVPKDQWVLMQPSGQYKSIASVEGNEEGTCGFSNQRDNASHIYDSLYEPDGMASWVLALLLYDHQYPKENILNHPWVVAAMKQFVTTIKTETNHAKSPYLQKHFLSNDGKGAPVKSFNFDTDDAVLTWAGFRPSDAAMTYGYNIPDNLYIATALDSLATAYTNAGSATDMKKATIITANSLAQKIKRGVDEYGKSTISVVGDSGRETNMTIYDFEVNGYAPGDSNRKVLIMDDANYPNLLTLPLLVNPQFFDMDKYNNTVDYIRSYYTGKYDYPTDGSFENYFYDSDHACSTAPAIHYQGLGSYTKGNQVWPMALVMDAFMQTINDKTFDRSQFWNDMQQLEGFLATQKDVLSFPESFNVCTPGSNPTRNNDSFGWMASTYVLFARGWFAPTITPY